MKKMTLASLLTIALVVLQSYSGLCLDQKIATLAVVALTGFFIHSFW